VAERRHIRLPLRIDKLPAAFHARIRQEREQLHKTWEEMEAESAAWVEWQEVPAGVRVLFPGDRLSHSNLWRWYTRRVEQRPARSYFNPDVDVALGEIRGVIVRLLEARAVK
jgi:hypothetical protein